MVYVLDKNNNPLMPTENHAKIRILLKTGRASVVRRMPFTNCVEHAYDIGNNNEYPLVFHKELSNGSFEEQTCGYLELNSDVYNRGR